MGHIEIKLISGSANKPLAEEISARLGVRPLGVSYLPNET